MVRTREAITIVMKLHPQAWAIDDTEPVRYMRITDGIGQNEAASFAVTLKLGYPSNQRKLPGFSDTTKVVDEFMNLMGLLSAGDYSAITAAIPEETYRTNFLQLGKRLAPDGIDVTIVGFTTMRDGTERIVEVSRPRYKMFVPDAGPSEELSSEKVEITGTLLFADATHGDSGQIKIVDDKGHTTPTIKVPEGMMGDIVKPLWDSRVTVTGRQIGNIIIMDDIEEV